MECDLATEVPPCEGINLGVWSWISCKKIKAQNLPRAFLLHIFKLLWCHAQWHPYQSQSDSGAMVPGPFRSTKLINVLMQNPPSRILLQNTKQKTPHLVNLPRLLIASNSFSTLKTKQRHLKCKLTQGNFCLKCCFCSFWEVPRSPG